MVMVFVFLLLIVLGSSLGFMIEGPAVSWEKWLVGVVLGVDVSSRPKELARVLVNEKRPSFLLSPLLLDSY